MLRDSGNLLGKNCKVRFREKSGI